MKVTRFTYPLVGVFVAVLLGAVAVGADIINPPPMGQIKGNLTTRSGDAIGFSSSATDPSVACDVCLVRKNPNILALQNGTSTQTLRVYETFTDANNGAWVLLNMDGISGWVRTASNGSGSSRPLSFSTNDGTNYWRMAAGASPHITPSGDNAFDLGSTALRLRSTYVATSILFGSDNTVTIGSATNSAKTVFTTSLDIVTGGSTTIGAGVGSVKMTSGNAATNAAWIPLQLAGSTYYVPGWTTNNP